MLVEIVGELFGTTLEGRLDKSCGGNLVLQYGFLPSKRHWTIVQGLLYDLIQKVGYYGHLRAMA